MKYAGANADRRVLFIGSDASRSGAPLYLINVLRWLNEHRKIPAELFLCYGGQLEADYAAVLPTTNLHTTFRRDIPEKFHAALNFHRTTAERWRAKVRRRVQRHRPALIYANTIAVASEVAACADLGIPVLWHLHELPHLISRYNVGGIFERAKSVPVRFIAVSDAVRCGLVEHHGVPPEKIEIISGFVRPEIQNLASHDVCRATLRRELGIPADAFVVGMCGLVAWNKGVDLFLSVAKALQLSHPGQPIHLAWLGPMESATREREVRFDLQQAGLEKNVHFLAERPQSGPFLAGLDVFFLSSREDSIPLVMLEAAFHSVPIVVFDRSGGGPGFVGKDAGVVVGYGDVSSVARPLVQLREQPELRRQMGLAARAKVISQYTLEQQSSKIADLITAQLAGGNISGAASGRVPKAA